MKVKVSLLITAVAILRTIDITKMKLSTSYKVRKVLTECQSAVSDFETKRVALAEQHGKLSEDASHYTFEKDEDKDAFQAKMMELMEDEVDIDVKPIPIDLLDEYINIEPNNVPYVEWFVSGLE